MLAREQASGGSGCALGRQHGLDRSLGPLACVFAEAASQHTWGVSLTPESGLTGAAADAAAGGQVVLCQSRP